MTAPRLTAIYRVTDAAENIAARAKAIAVEQSVEMPVAAITSRMVLDDIVGQVQDIADMGHGVFEVRIGLAVATTGLEAGQLLNMLFGNTSMHPDVVLHDVELPDDVLAAFGGPRHGLEGLRTRHETMVRAIATDLECEPHGLAALAGVEDGQDLPALDVVERKLESLKADRERLGAVNLRADDELAEVEQKQTQLTTERDDLTEAIRKLRIAIQSLNKEGRERLLAAFDVVNGHFKELFTTLFGGGSAELQLVESEDPLEAGLEILARPPGKKPQTMTLLSGGEQALTAMSLIFAVFLTNPSPICVLDEVDAPLDDANVERFCDLLEEMRKRTDTRFVTITHNPITMARMDRLFGVTQAERGVSQLVSVDLGQAETLIAAE
jgi:hypothetical protein